MRFNKRINEEGTFIWVHISWCSGFILADEMWSLKSRSLYIVSANIFSDKARLKNMLVCRHPGLYFWVHPTGRKNFIFYHFEMEKIALIPVYNIFVTKNFFFRNEHPKKFLTCAFLVDLVGWRQTNIFLSLA